MKPTARTRTASPEELRSKDITRGGIIKVYNRQGTLLRYELPKKRSNKHR